MILHWQQLVLHYGGEITGYQDRFDAAGQTTFGLLCCRYAPDGYRLTYSSEEHAEERLLNSEVWREQIPRALEGWTPYNNTIVVTMAVNRSPCYGCTAYLARALRDLHRRFPVACEQNRFILAMRGAYEASETALSTTFNGLITLQVAGWELCVLQTGNQLSARGEILRQGIERIAGRGIVRLG